MISNININININMNKYTIFQTIAKTYSTYVYLGFLLLYNGIGAWYDAKNKLIEYREHKLDNYEKNEIKDEWSAVKYGANTNFTERFFNSTIWPVKIIINFIPFMVLQLNPPPTETVTNTKIETLSSNKQK